MDVLDAEVRSKLFADDLPVYTKIRDEMPARYGENAMAVNSLVADGCIIEGTVENSILFRGVRIAPDAHVKNCIIMQDGQVHSNAYIENCILDKQAVIKRNARLIGPNAYPIVIAKNVVI
jgi:glucose-1-phosphate adenylyltransferase